MQSLIVERCGVVVDGAPQDFAQCQALMGDASGLRMGWSLSSDAKAWHCSPGELMHSTAHTWHLVSIMACEACARL